MEKPIKLLPHQQAAREQILDKLTRRKLCYLFGKTRSGKSLTVLMTAKDYGADNVLFVTKKKAISSIEDDYNKAKLTYKLTVINYESLHKIVGSFDLIIFDEAHSNLSAFPKPSTRTKYISNRFHSTPMILMSGTPAIESYSQYFHQFWISDYSPFKQYPSFYKWAKDFVQIKQKRIGTHFINDYSKADEKLIDTFINPFMVKMDKPKDEFSDPKSHFLYIDIPYKIKSLADRLIKDRAVIGKTGYVMAEAPAKLQSKIHQIYNGTVIIEDEAGNSNTVILDSYKANFIYNRFKGKKIAIMYYYKGELDMLQCIFGDEITTDLDEFNNSNKNIALQQKTTEGMNVSKADCLVYLNFGFSGKDFVQSLDRLTIRGRIDNNVYFIFEKGGFNEKLYKVVSKKKDFNLRAFKKEFGL